ncbi:MAG: response regulator [Anaerolineales bacterium]
MPEKILVVDDDVDTLRLVGLMLERNGYEIVAANSGRQALLAAVRDQPDLIILDVMMPDMDGYEVTRKLRNDPKTLTIPIIMFTAKSQIDDKVTGFEAGADDYLTKPTQPRELLAHIKAVLARTAKSRMAGVEVPSIPTVVQEKAHTIGILAPKGGLGVTTLTLNLGVMLRARSKKSTLIAEYRPGQGTMGLQLGYTRPEGLVELLQRQVSELSTRAIEPYLVAHQSGARFLFSSYHPKDAVYLKEGKAFESLTRTLAYMSQYMVIDLGAAITPIAQHTLPQCDRVIVVIEPVPQTLEQTKAMLLDLREMGIGSGRIKVVLINRIRSDIQMSWSQVQEEIQTRVDVLFTPAPELLYQAAICNTPAVLYQSDSITAQQFTKLADQIVQPA